MMLLLPLPLLLELRACTLAEQRAFYGSVPLQDHPVVQAADSGGLLNGFLAAASAPVEI